MAFDARTLKLHALYTFACPQLKSELLEVSILIYFSVSDLLLHLTKMDFKDKYLVVNEHLFKE